MERYDCPNVERTRNKGAIVKSSNWHIAEKIKMITLSTFGTQRIGSRTHSSFFRQNHTTVASSSDNESEEALCQKRVGCLQSKF